MFVCAQKYLAYYLAVKEICEGNRQINKKISISLFSKGYHTFSLWKDQRGCEDDKVISIIKLHNWHLLQSIAVTYEVKKPHLVGI